MAKRESQRHDLAMIRQGMTVRATDGIVGTVEQVMTESTSGAMTSFVLLMESGERVEVPASLVDIDASTQEVRLLAGRESLTVGMSALDAVGDRLTVPVHEEVLVPTTRPIELGEVRVHKRVEEVPTEVVADVQRDDVHVERVPVGRPIDAVPAARNEGETIVIPVVEEVLVTEKRLVLKEEIRITRRRVTERVPVRGTVRREVVEVEEVVAPDSAAVGTSVSPER